MHWSWADDNTASVDQPGAAKRHRIRTLDSRNAATIPSLIQPTDAALPVRRSDSSALAAN